MGTDTDTGATATGEEATPRWVNRIVRQSVEDPGVLLDNPLNFRIHSDTQKAATKGNLNELGWVRALIVNQNTGRIVDGHLRAELARENGERVIVDWVDLTEEEERQALRSLDSLAAAAGVDVSKLRALHADSPFADPNTRALMDAEFRKLAAKDEQRLTKDKMDELGAGDGTAGDAESTSDVVEDEDGEQYFQVAFALTKEQRDIVQRAIKTAKRLDGIATSMDAIVEICDFYFKNKQVPV